MRRSRVEDRGPAPTHLKIKKYIGFLSNTGPNLLKTKKLPSEHSMLAHHWPIPVSEMPFKRHFAGGPMMVRFKCYLDSLSPYKKHAKKTVRVWQNFLDPHMVAYIDDAHVGPRIVHEDWQPIDFFIRSHLLLLLHVTWEFYMAKWCHIRKGR